MILPMRKVTLFVALRHRDEALRRLRRMGVLHIQPQRTPISDDLTRMEGKLERVERSLRILGREEEPGIAGGARNQEEAVNEILSLSAERNRLRGELEETRSMLDWYTEWGRISRADLDALRKHGIHLRLYRADKGALKKLPEDAHVEILKAEKTLRLLAFFGESAESRLELKEEPIPSRDRGEAEEESFRLGTRIREIEARLKEFVPSAGAIADFRQSLRRSLEFARVRAGMGGAEEITWLQGWCPEGRLPEVRTAAEREGWGLLIENPEPDDLPPTRVEAGRWARIIQPVFDFLGVVPGYREHDISRWFLMFFSVFVAMIIGDAAYGALFLVVAAAMHIQAARKKQPFSLAVQLLYVLSIATIAWGTVTGTWFGSRDIAALPMFKAFIIPQLASFPELFPGTTVDPRAKIMTICFIIALIHLSLACVLSFIKQMPRRRAWAQLGWLSLLGGLFFLVLQLVLGRAMPVFAAPLAAAGLVVIIVFSNQEKGVGFFKGLARGLGGAFNTFLDSITSFSNIISYIRLFAVGMATVAIASSFNDLAAPLMKGAGVPAAVLILIIGHGLNIVMALLSVIVHGIRLNVLEFSNQLGMEWAGYEYRPFKDPRENNKERENP